MELAVWDQEYVNMEIPGQFTFNSNGTGDFCFGLVHGEMDCCLETISRKERIRSVWVGNDEMDFANGYGWALIEDGELRCHIYLHQGDDSMFRARKS